MEASEGRGKALSHAPTLPSCIFLLKVHLQHPSYHDNFSDPSRKKVFLS
jgi:hypothetical protein